MKNILVILLLLISRSVFGQFLCKDRFVEYGNVIREIKSCRNLNSVTNKYDYVSVMLLDSAEIKLIKKVNSEAVDEFRMCLPGLAKMSNFIQLDRTTNKIINFLSIPAIQSRIITTLYKASGENLPELSFDFPIYVKGDKAVFTIYGHGFSDTYFAKIKDATILLYWVKGMNT